MPRDKKDFDSSPEKGSPKYRMRQKMLSGEYPATATALVVILSDLLDGFEWFQWEPDVVGQEVIDFYKVSMPLPVRDKLWALVTALTTDLFYTDVQVFNHICNALSGGPTPMANFEPAEVEEVAEALIEVGMSDQDDVSDVTQEFTEEVKGYIAYLLEREGLPAVGMWDFVPDLAGPKISMAEDPAMVSVEFKDRKALSAEIEKAATDHAAKISSDLMVAGYLESGSLSMAPENII